MERLAGLEPACIALEERCLNPLGHRRAITAKSWYRGRGSNSTSPLCRRGALNQKATPALWLWGQDSNLRINWLTARRLATWLPHKNWSGTSDLNRDSLGPRPSGLIRFPSPRMSKIWSERLEIEPAASGFGNPRSHPTELRPQTLEQAAGIEPAFLR